MGRWGEGWGGGEREEGWGEGGRELVACDLMTENPGSNKKALMTKAKAVVIEDDSRVNMPSHLSTKVKS